MGDSRIRPHQWDDARSELGVPARELDSEGGEDEPEVAPIREISRTEERGPELPIREHPLCDRLSDGALPRPSQPIQPVDGRLVEIPGPESDLVQDTPAGSPQTASAIPMPILSGLRTAETIEDSRFT